MFKNNRSKSNELRMLDALSPRVEFTEKEKQYHLYLEKGYEGEILFDAMLDQLENENFILRDLLFEVNNTTFQIDSLLITQDTVLLFDVKNYEGDYYYDGELFKTMAGTEVKDPLLQLKRSESLLRQMLKRLGFHFILEAYIIFINPEFSLFQAPLNQPIILPNQLNRFIKKLSNKPSKLNNSHTRLADKLLSLHITDSRFTRVPKYEYELLRKGVFCPSCKEVYTQYKQKKFTCAHCQYQENVEEALMRTVEEYRLLFPERKITTRAIYEWCNQVLPAKMIRRLLTNNLHSIGEFNTRFYQ